MIPLILQAGSPACMCFSPSYSCFPENAQWVARILAQSRHWKITDVAPESLVYV